jgi:ribose/xylose/arabinose/galactoside ABC-type transport system permease subunit
MTATSDPWGASQRLLMFRATRALILGVLAMAAAAWLISLPAVVVGLACGVVPALLIARSRALPGPIIATLATAVAGAVAGSLFLGHGPTAMRTLGGLVTSLAVGPWLVVLGFVLWMRAQRPRGTPP